MKKKSIITLILLLVIGGTWAFVSINKAGKAFIDDTESLQEQEQEITIVFNPDSAYHFCKRQCDFGPRTMNSDAHRLCGEWIASKFRSYGMTVIEQKADLNGYDGTTLHSTNIIASYHPERTSRVLICAHWDSRPWADNDTDSTKWHTPIDGADDGASGVAVMMELARLLQQNDSAKIGIDFVCFDAEDWGVPQWADVPDTEDSWALGAQYWAANPHVEGYQARYGILLDMVGGQGAEFYKELFSLKYAPGIVDLVWKAANTVGYGSYFRNDEGGAITDDHDPVNRIARIPTIDIIPYYPNCPRGSFGYTWHTINDNMEHIDANTLKAVGQTLVQVIFSEKD